MSFKYIFYSNMFSLIKRNFCKTLTNYKLSSDFIKVMKQQYEPQKIPQFPVSKFGGKHIVSLISDTSEEGIKCANYLQRILLAARAPIEFEHISSNAEKKTTEEAISSIIRNGTGIKIGLTSDENTKREQFVLHRALNVFACVVHVNSFAGFNCRFSNFNLLLLMQNISDDYSLMEYEPAKGVVQSLRHSEDETTYNYMCFVFAIAKAELRQKITFVHKRDELPLIDGHFIEIAESVAKNYENIEIEFVALNDIVRNLLITPHIYDCICCPERYSTVLATITAAVAGGPTLFCAIEHGNNYAIFKPLQTRLSFEGYKTVSPYGLLSCCVHLLRYLMLKQPAFKLWHEFSQIMKDEYRTQEFGGNCTDEDVICHVINKLNEYQDFPRDLPN